MTPTTITRQDLIRANREALANHQLQAQTSIAGACSYTGPCAVGVAMPPSARDNVPNSTIRQLFQEGHVQFKDVHIGEAQVLQHVHDAWARRRLLSLHNGQLLGLDMPDYARDFMIEHEGEPANEKLFREFLDLLEHGRRPVNK